MKVFILKLKRLFQSMKNYKEIHLCDIVTYKGERYFVNNGTKSDNNGNIIWDICSEDKDEHGMRKSAEATRYEFKRVFCWFNIKNALFFDYIFWKTYWFEIELEKMKCVQERSSRE